MDKAKSTMTPDELERWMAAEPTVLWKKGVKPKSAIMSTRPKNIEGSRDAANIRERGTTQKDPVHA